MDQVATTATRVTVKAAAFDPKKPKGDKVECSLADLEKQGWQITTWDTVRGKTRVHLHRGTGKNMRALIATAVPPGEPAGHDDSLFEGTVIVPEGDQ